MAQPVLTAAALEEIGAAIARPVGSKAHCASEFLKKEGLPPGLVEEMDGLTDETPMRFWIIDNSDSMRKKDGQHLEVHEDGSISSTPCSRWAELADTLRWHGAVAEELQAWTQFRLLNAAMGCQQNITVGAKKGVGLGSLEKLIGSEPVGETPLVAALKGVTAEIAKVSDALVKASKVAVVIIASDGEPSDGDVRDALFELQKLPVAVRVRLCTNSADVLGFWNKVDKTSAGGLDILDDVHNEAKEVAKGNNWLPYSLVLHHVREFGCTKKVLDLLDERSLQPAEIREFIVLLFGSHLNATLPDPGADMMGFIKATTDLLAAEPPIWNLTQKKKTPWIDLKRGRRGSASCALS